MKNLFILFIALSAFTFNSNAQETATAVTKGAEALNASKSSGEYTFILPSTITQEDVDQSMKYYSHYMTTNFNNDSKEAVITLKENTQKNRYVIARFLTACGVKTVQVGNENYDISAFINKYLQ